MSNSKFEDDDYAFSTPTRRRVSSLLMLLFAALLCWLVCSNIVSYFWPTPVDDQPNLGQHDDPTP